MKRIFERSIVKHNGRYMGFYGDGDSKAFANIENIYENKNMTKHSHYQKLVGNRLRKLKKR